MNCLLSAGNANALHIFKATIQGLHFTRCSFTIVKMYQLEGYLELGYLEYMFEPPHSLETLASDWVVLLREVQHKTFF